VATIITVHGTFATGPEEGEAWWQKGSEFEGDVQRYVESEDGSTLEFKPFVWDGLNSETSRREAGKRLFAELRKLEAKDQPHALVGHSHGGSVINTALMTAAAKNTPLSHLGRWITAGTPFVQLGRPPFVYMTLGLLNKAIYLSLIISFVLLSTELALVATEGPIAIDPELGFLVGLVSACALPPIAFHLFHYRKLRSVPSFANTRVAAFCKLHFLNSWVGLRHSDDEAIAGLQTIQISAPKIFPERFAAAPIAAMSLFAFLALLLAIAIWPEPTAEICRALGGVGRDWACYYTDHPPQSAFLQAVTRAQVFVALVPRVLISQIVTTEVGGWLAVIVMVSALSLVTVWLVLSCLLFVAIFQKAGERFSKWLSTRLDSSALKQLRRSSLGVDTTGEGVLGCQVHPVWSADGCRPLPQNLSSELTATSDRDAAQLLSKFRQAIGRLPSQQGRMVGFDPLLGCLTWNELIHTSYFVVPRFRKLVCYAIAHAPGFRPSDAFKRDPDYALMERWLEEIRPKPAKAAPEGEARIATDSAAASSPIRP
jgi:hypothetical protein